VCVSNAGTETGIYQISIRDKKTDLLLPEAVTVVARFGPEGKSIVYPVGGRGEIQFYRQGWDAGKIEGEAELALRIPFAFPLQYKGNAYDFSADLSSLVYVRPTAQNDLYLLTYEK